MLYMYRRKLHLIEMSRQCQCQPRIALQLVDSFIYSVVLLFHAPKNSPKQQQQQQQHKQRQQQQQQLLC